MSETIRVTVRSGALGAGKTTTLNHLLSVAGVTVSSSRKSAVGKSPSGPEDSNE